MNKSFLIFSVILTMVLAPFIVEAETIKKEEGYFTTEDIVSDIIFPVLDRRVQKEYKDEHIRWDWDGLANIQYNSNHYYDITVRVEAHPQLIKGKDKYGTSYDLAKLRISPSCDSNKINKMVCKHGFKIEIFEYERLSQEE